MHGVRPGHYCKSSCLPMTTLEVSHHQVTTTAHAFDTHKHLGETGHLMSMGIPSHPLTPPFPACVLTDVFSL